jgi:hypothetical protein
VLARSAAVDRAERESEREANNELLVSVDWTVLRAHEELEERREMTLLRALVIDFITGLTVFLPTSATWTMPTDGAEPVPLKLFANMRSLRKRAMRAPLRAVDSPATGTAYDRALLLGKDSAIVELEGEKSDDQLPSQTRTDICPSDRFQYGGKETITGVFTSSISSL